ncbi:transporter substrate-binding domain-containing protein [Desulfobacterales bacterium HSG16]|nr:transporter substrate-binding domain-containing protein [Desulfobacterales bacterium HSG16]
MNTEAFDAADFLSKEEVSNDEINLRKLYMDRVQLIFIDRYVAAHLIRTKYPEYTEHLEFMEPALEFKQLYVAFSKKAPDYKKKLDVFNAGLNAITQNGTLEKIIMKHSLEAGVTDTGGQRKR